MRQHWTKEQKAEFWAAFTAHRDEGCNIREAWSRARMDFQAEGKAAPGLQTFANWYRKAMRPQEDADQAAPEDAERELSDGSDQSDGSDPASPEGSAEASGAETDDAAQETAEETPDPDYTRRLELMCRLYRSRSE